MPRDAERAREYRRNYYREYAARKRLEAIALLGDKCVICGITGAESLEIDHIDPSTKSFVVTAGWNKPYDVWFAEVMKCQLLCIEHHKEKTLIDTGKKAAKGTHGTLSAYRYCGPPKCEDCKRAKREYTRKYRTTHERTDTPSARRAGLRPL